MATPGIDPNWPEPVGRRTHDILSRPFALAAGGTWEVMNAAALHWAPAWLGFAVVFCGAVWLRARKRDLIDMESEKPAVDVIAYHEPMLVLYEPPHGGSARSLPHLRIGAEFVSVLTVAHKLPRVARLMVEGRAEAEDGSILESQPAYWAPENAPRSEGERFLEVRDFESKRVRVFVLFGGDFTGDDSIPIKRVSLVVTDKLRPNGPKAGTRLNIPGETEV